MALTGWGQAENRRRSLEAEFEQRLMKPLHLSLLQELADDPTLTVRLKSHFPATQVVMGAGIASI